LTRKRVKEVNLPFKYQDHPISHKPACRRAGPNNPISPGSDN
jgi:hypothetical protein